MAERTESIGVEEACREVAGGTGTQELPDPANDGPG
jgi:hypothetical protein